MPPLLALAVSNWFASPSAGIVAANAFLNAALGTIGAGGRPGVVIHMALLTAALLVLVHHHRAASLRS